MKLSTLYTPLVKQLMRASVAVNMPNSIVEFVESQIEASEDPTDGTCMLQPAGFMEHQLRMQTKAMAPISGYTAVGHDEYELIRTWDQSGISVIARWIVHTDSDRDMEFYVAFHSLQEGLTHMVQLKYKCGRPCIAVQVVNVLDMGFDRKEFADIMYGVINTDLGFEWKKTRHGLMHVNYAEKPTVVKVELIETTKGFPYLVAASSHTPWLFKELALPIEMWSQYGLNIEMDDEVELCIHEDEVTIKRFSMKPIHVYMDCSTNTDHHSLHVKSDIVFKQIEKHIV